MALGARQLDWANAWGAPPVEPDPKLETAMAELRKDTVTANINNKRNRNRNLAMLVIAASGLLAATGIIREKQEQQQTQVVSSNSAEN